MSSLPRQTRNTLCQTDRDAAPGLAVQNPLVTRMRETLREKCWDTCHLASFSRRCLESSKWPTLGRKELPNCGPQDYPSSFCRRSYDRKKTVRRTEADCGSSFQRRKRTNACLNMRLWQAIPKGLSSGIYIFYEGETTTQDVRGTWRFRHLSRCSYSTILFDSPPVLATQSHCRE